MLEHLSKNRHPEVAILFVPCVFSNVVISNLSLLFKFSIRLNLPVCLLLFLSLRMK